MAEILEGVFAGIETAAEVVANILEGKAELKKLQMARADRRLILQQQQSIERQKSMFQVMIKDKEFQTSKEISEAEIGQREADTESRERIENARLKSHQDLQKLLGAQAQDEIRLSAEEARVFQKELSDQTLTLEETKIKAKAVERMAALASAETIVDKQIKGTADLQTGQIDATAALQVEELDVEREKLTAQRDIAQMQVTAALIQKQTERIYARRGDASQIEKDLRTLFLKLDKPFREASSALERAKELFPTPESMEQENATPQSDTALVFMFMKAWDPESVVRESEFKLAAEGKGLFDKAGLLIEKIKTGVLLTAPQRAKMIEAMGVSVRGMKNLHDQAESEMRRVVDIEQSRNPLVNPDAVFVQTSPTVDSAPSPITTSGFKEDELSAARMVLAEVLEIIAADPEANRGADPHARVVDKLVNSGYPQAEAEALATTAIAEMGGQ